MFATVGWKRIRLLNIFLCTYGIVLVGECGFGGEEL